MMQTTTAVPATKIPCTPAPAPTTATPVALAALIRNGVQAGWHRHVPLPTVIGHVLPSISWLSDTPDAAVQFPDEVRALAKRVEAAVAEIPAMQTATEPADVIVFMTMVAERRGMELPCPALLALDAQTIAAAIPSDLWPVACFRIWSTFAYRRLPECSDFRLTVIDELRERAEAVARLMTANIKVARRRWLDAERVKADARHANEKVRERARWSPDPGEPANGVQLGGCVLDEVGPCPSLVAESLYPTEKPAKSPCDQNTGKSGVRSSELADTSGTQESAVAHRAADKPLSSSAASSSREECPLPRFRSAANVRPPASESGDGDGGGDTEHVVPLSASSAGLSGDDAVGGGLADAESGGDVLDQ